MIDRSKRVRLFVHQDLSRNLYIAVSVEQAKYLFNVMRLNVGQCITVLDGKTGEYEAVILQKGRRTGKIHVQKKIKSVSEPGDLWLVFSPLRKNRTEWVVEKATELGVRKIIPVVTSRTANYGFKMQRLESIMIEALEQCGGTSLPELKEPVSLEVCLEYWPSDRLLIFCDEKLLKNDSANLTAIHNCKAAGILVGPEGGFSDEEGYLIRQKKTVVSISLGPHILRADTAAVSAISLWHHVNVKVD